VLTGVGAVRHTARVQPGQSVAVIGCGGVGLNVVQGARLSGAEHIIAVDRNPEALERARTLGATHVVDALAGSAVETVIDLTDGGADHVFEVVGLSATIAQACEMAGIRGTVTVIGLPRPGEQIQFPSEHLFAEKRIQGSKMGRQWRLDVPYLCSLYLSGRLMLDELASRSIALSEINEALNELDGNAVARTMIVFDAE